MNNNDDKYGALLRPKSRDELNVIAKRLNISGYRRLNKDALLAAILQTSNKEKLVKSLSVSWWDRYHNHIYGVATLISLVLGVIFFWLQSQPSTPNGPVARDIAQDSSKGPPSPITARQLQSSESIEKEEARIASTAKDFSPISMTQFFSRWYDTSATSLQMDQLEQELLGKTIIWTGRIRSIESGRDGGIRVIVIPEEGYGDAFLDFDASQRAEFLRLKKNQAIRFTGVIRSFMASPFLKDCRLLQVIN